MPYLVLTTEDGSQRVQVPAWPRPEAKVEPVELGFADDEAGRQALQAAREALAAGREAELTSGCRLRFGTAPLLARQALEELGSEQAVLRLCPGEPRSVTVHAEIPGGAVSHRFDARPIPPSCPGVHSFGAVTDCLALWLDLEPGEFPEVSLHVRLELRRARSHRCNAAAALLVRGFAGDGARLEAPGLLPADPSEVAATGAGAEQLDDLNFQVQLFSALTIIEDHLGVHLRIPDNLTWGDLEDAVKAATVLQNRGGTGSFADLEQELDDREVGGFLDGVALGGVVRHPMHATVFGVRLLLGMAEMALPRFRLVVPTPAGRPGRTAVKLISEPGQQLPFRLLDITDGNPTVWRTEILLGPAAATAALRGPATGQLVDVAGHPLVG